MKKLQDKLVLYPAPLIKSTAKKVVSKDGLSGLLDEMREVMYGVGGIGIAANQIGDPRAVAIALQNIEQENSDELVLINPVVIDHSNIMVAAKEGCLSLPYVYGDINRPEWVMVRYQDEDLVIHEKLFENWNGRVVHHEIDHLYGMCIYDRMHAIDKAGCRNQIEALKITCGIIPKRLKRKGLRLR